MPERHSLVRLVQSRGVRIRVVVGRVWVREEGWADDRVLEPGADYVVAGDGVVIVEQAPVDRRGAIAEVALSYPCELPGIWKRALGRA